MVQFRWINMSLFVILGLQFTAVTGQNPPSFIASVGDEITLPCENVIKNQDKCDSTSWVVSRHIRSSAQELVNLGQIRKNEISKDKSNRLSVTAKCSLVIKNVTDEDVGRYSCRQFNKLGRQQGPDSEVLLSVVNMDQHQNNYTDILFCTVLTYEGCEYTVEWLHEGNKNDLETSQHTCSATVTFTTPPLDQKSNYYELLKCNVTDNKSGQMLLCNVGLQSSCEKTGSTLVAISEKDETKQDLWWLIIVAVGLAALLIIIVVVIRWKKTKGNKTQMDEHVGLSLNPAVTQPGPETRQDMADPEDGVSYASISYTKKTNSKALVCSKDDDDDAAVTYSTVNVSSSSAGASADPSNLYATVNKPNKEEATA